MSSAYRDSILHDVKQQEIIIEYCPTDNMLADYLSKSQSRGHCLDKCETQSLVLLVAMQSSSSIRWRTKTHENKEHNRIALFHHKDYDLTIFDLLTLKPISFEESTGTMY